MDSKKIQKQISQNIKRINENIAEASLKAGRSPSEITVVGVTKKIGTEAMEISADCGIKVFGENKIQEAVNKHKKIGTRAEWHFIGHLQKNKVKYIFDVFTLIHSVDSYELAKMISDKGKVKDERMTDILLQVNIGREESKHGLMPEVVLETAERIAELPNISLKGLMAIPPRAEKPNDNRDYFKQVIEIGEKINEKRLPCSDISLYSFGMSNDYSVAIEEGATHIRIGRAIFGEREND